MAYMSDIDLATLHKTRLEEKVNYKLSWWTNSNKNNVKLDDDSKSTSTKQYNCHKKKPVVKSNGTGNSKSVCSNKKLIGGEKRDEIVNKKEIERVTKTPLNENYDNKYVEKPIKNKYECKYKASLDFDDLSDDGYFSSETRRRRSGTWP